MLSITSTTEINTGDCLLVSSHSWLARQIQRFQKLVNKKGGEWNHAAQFWVCYDELFVIESIEKGIVCTPFKDYIDSDKKLLICKPQFLVDGSQFGAFMLPYAGRSRYGFFNLIFAQILKIITFGKIWIGPSKKNTRRFICGEWVAFVYNHFNSNIFTSWNKVAPVDIYQNPYFNKYEFIR